MKKTAIYIICLFLFFSSCNRSETITFRSGDFRIEGELLKPKGEGPFPLVIFVHGDGPAYRNYFSILKEVMNESGYATLMWDKPGFGSSTGNFNEDVLFEQRAQILLDAIQRMKEHEDINPEQFGLWGISQAGYVIPKVLEKTEDIKFIIMIGCPAENGIKQTAYLIKRQLELEGSSIEEAEEAEFHFKGIYYAQTFEEYIKHALPLYENPIQRQLGFVSALWDSTNWQIKEKDDKAFFDPMRVMENVKIPSLILYGEKDTQVNPWQGKKAYEEAFKKAENENYIIKVIPDSDHNIILCETGSMKERYYRTTDGWKNYSPEYLKILKEWLQELKK